MKYKKGFSFLLYFAVLCLGLVSALAVVKTCLFSFDIDEGYALAQGYRMATGDHLIDTMWEPHQFSAYPVALFTALYLKLTGSTTGIVIVMRGFGAVIHLLVGLYFAGCFRKLLPARERVLLFLIHFNFLTKWIQTPEFELMHYWLLLLGFAVLWKYYCGKRQAVYLVLLGIVMLLQVFNYPTLLLLYPVYVFGLVKTGVRPVKESLLSTAGAVLPGVGILIYWFATIGMERLQTCIGYIMADPSHNDKTLAMKLMAYGREFAGDVLLIGSCFAGAFLLSLLWKNCNNRFAVSYLLAMAGLTAAQLVGCILFDQNQFFLQERYLLAAVFSFAYYFVKKKKHNTNYSLLFLFGVLPAWISFLGALAVSNMTVGVAYSKLFFCVLISILFILMDIGEKRETIWVDFFCVLLIGSLMLCKLILVRVNGCLPVTMNAHFARIADGPAKGMFIQEQYAYPMNENYALLQEYVTDEDRLFYFGSENLIYLYTEAEVCVASTQATSVFDQSFLDYFSLHPEKLPTVVAVDKTYETNPVYHYPAGNKVIADWIAGLEYEDRIETDTMILYLGVNVK